MLEVAFLEDVHKLEGYLLRNPKIVVRIPVKKETTISPTKTRAV